MEFKTESLFIRDNKKSLIKNYTKVWYVELLIELVTLIIT